jgi:NTE family protein
MTMVKTWLRSLIGRKRPVALVLGGGGARGLAHIGVLETLDTAGLRPDLIVGTSIGAVIGAMYAQSGSSSGLRQRMQTFLASDFFRSVGVESFYTERNNDLLSLIDKWLQEIRLRFQLTRALTQRGVMPRSVLSEGIRMLVDDGRIEDCAIPFACVAVELLSGESRTFSNGDLIEAVTASSSIPGIIEAVSGADGVLVDGAVTSTTPVNEARALGARTVVAVDIHHDLRTEEIPSAGYEVMFRVGDIASAHCDRLQLEGADLVLRPRVGHVHWAQFDQVDTLCDAGSSIAEEHMSLLHAFLPKTRIRT